MNRTCVKPFLVILSIYNDPYPRSLDLKSAVQAIYVKDIWPQELAHCTEEREKKREEFLQHFTVEETVA